MGMNWKWLSILRVSQSVPLPRHGIERTSKCAKLSHENIEECALDNNAENQCGGEEHHILENIDNQTDSDVDLINLDQYSENFDDVLLYSTMI